MLDSVTEYKIKTLQAKICEIVGVHHLSEQKYRKLASSGLPFKPAYDGDYKKTIETYYRFLVLTLLNAMIEAKLDIRIEAPKLLNDGIISSDHPIFETLKNIDPEISAYCHALAAAQANTTIQ